MFLVGLVRVQFPMERSPVVLQIPLNCPLVTGFVLLASNNGGITESKRSLFYAISSYISQEKYNSKILFFGVPSFGTKKLQTFLYPYLDPT